VPAWRRYPTWQTISAEEGLGATRAIQSPDTPPLRGERARRALLEEALGVLAPEERLDGVAQRGRWGEGVVADGVDEQHAANGGGSASGCLTKTESQRLVAAAGIDPASRGRSHGFVTNVNSWERDVSGDAADFPTL